ncbi:hypothetical protein H4Q26_008388, partial [Puccinia striiformis f. sp. tritici PST-130]
MRYEKGREESVELLAYPYIYRPLLNSSFVRYRKDPSMDLDTPIQCMTDLWTSINLKIDRKGKLQQVHPELLARRLDSCDAQFVITSWTGQATRAENVFQYLPTDINM